VAQTAGPITQADIQRLQDEVFQAGSDVQQLRARDAAKAAPLQTQLDDLRDEVIYLKVKLRKDGTLGRSEYTSVRERIDTVRSQAREVPATASAPSTAPAPAASATPAGRPAAQSSSAAGSTSRATVTNNGEVEVLVGTELDVRLAMPLNSGTAKVEDRFEATTLAVVEANGRTVIPAGSVMRGIVSAVDPATRTNRNARMTVAFDQVTINGRDYAIRATVTQAIEGEGVKGETGRIATGAGVGAIIGGLLGGFKGALAGILVGGGGTIAATEGKQVDLPQGTVLRVRFDSPLKVTVPPAGR
jgi:hypothetical protein